MNKPILVIAVGFFAMQSAPMSFSSGGHPPPPPEDPYRRILYASNHIMSWPSAWRANSEQLAMFSASSIDLGWDQQSEVRDFKAAALDLVVFGTTWVEKLTDAESSSLYQRLSKMTMDASFNAPEVA